MVVIENLRFWLSNTDNLVATGKLSSKDEKIIVTALLHGNKLKYSQRDHSYITRSSVGGMTTEENQKYLISFEKQIVDIYSYLVES